MQESTNQDWDVEDIIEPSKVLKQSSSATIPPNTSSQTHNTSHDSESSANQESEGKHSDSKHESDKGSELNEDGGEKRGRRTRSKRPRSGEDFEQLVLPERKRELRSSASRLAAAAAARFAAEAKMASQDSE